MIEDAPGALLLGVRAVLLGSGTALSMFGAVLAEQGADVIRIEPPSKGDDNGMQQVLKPEPGRPGLAKGGEHPAPA